MYMASRKRNPFFRRPHVLTRWSLAELENPHWPAPLYSVRASMEKAVCLTECLWCFLAAPPNPPPAPLPSRRTPVHPQLPSTLQHPDSPSHPLYLCFSLDPTPSPLTATRSWQVRGGHPITRTGHWPPRTPTFDAAITSQVIEDTEELRNGRGCARLSVPRVPILLHNLSASDKCRNTKHFI